MPQVGRKGREVFVLLNTKAGLYYSPGGVLFGMTLETASSILKTVRCWQRELPMVSLVAWHKGDSMKKRKAGQSWVCLRGDIHVQTWMASREIAELKAQWSHELWRCWKARKEVGVELEAKNWSPEKWVFNPRWSLTFILGVMVWHWRLVVSKAIWFLL